MQLHMSLSIKEIQSILEEMYGTETTRFLIIVSNQNFFLLFHNQTIPVFEESVTSVRVYGNVRWVEFTNIGASHRDRCFQPISAQSKVVINGNETDSLPIKNKEDVQLIFNKLYPIASTIDAHVECLEKEKKKLEQKATTEEMPPRWEDSPGIFDW